MANEMTEAMYALLHWFMRHNLPVPEGIEFRFGDEGAAHRFEAALKHDADQNGAYLFDGKRNRVSSICGFNIQPTFQKYGPPYSVEMLPAFHPAMKRSEGG